MTTIVQQNVLVETTREEEAGACDNDVQLLPINGKMITSRIGYYHVSML